MYTAFLSQGKSQGPGSGTYRFQRIPIRLEKQTAMTVVWPQMSGIPGLAIAPQEHARVEAPVARLGSFTSRDFCRHSAVRHRGVHRGARCTHTASWFFGASKQGVFRLCRFSRLLSDARTCLCTPAAALALVATPFLSESKNNSGWSKHSQVFSEPL